VERNEMLFEKVLFLKSLFKDVHEDELLYLAGRMECYADYSSLKKLAGGNWLLFNTNPGYSDTKLFVYFGDDSQINTQALLPDENAFFYLMNLNVLEDFQNIYPEKSFEIYHYLDNYDTIISQA
jgi:hypothetical protein